MARQIYEFAPTIPAGTQKVAPVTRSLTIPTRAVDLVELTIPPGPSGLMGFALAVGGQQVIPYNVGAWIITDDDQRTWPLDDYPTSGAWTLIGYNTDIFDHTVYVRFLVSMVPDAAGILPPTPIPAAQLTPIPDLGALPGFDLGSGS